MQAKLFTPEVSVETLKKMLVVHTDNQLVFKNQALKSKFNALAFEIDDSLKNVELVLKPRNHLPKKLNFFPLNLKFIKRFILRLYAFLFRSETHTKIHLLRITRNLQVMSQDLFVSIDHLVENQQRLQAEIASLKGTTPRNRSSEYIFSDAEPETLKLDEFFVALTREFRGSMQEIKDRQTIYIPYIKEAQAGSAYFPVLDIACGRGEWLELLREHELHAKGIDLNQIFVKNCQAAGLDVEVKDLFEYLELLPSNSLGAITGFHIIEHIPFPKLISFFDEVLRVLRPGGVAIFETPNPENVLVGSYSFYLDPTHLNPLPKAITKLMLAQRGFKSIQSLDLSPPPDNLKLQGSDLAERFNHYFYCALDYGVVAYK